MTVDGQDDASTTAIAQGAGISQGYLFRLFPSERALFLAAAERAFRETEAALRRRADGSPTFPELRRRHENPVSGGDPLRLQLHVCSGALEDPERRGHPVGQGAFPGHFGPAADAATAP
ncbi:TetR/AcrR family transcriptional regulator [Streptomyces malaysiense]|uniref:HTH tetR-type domain-containing protein n=1 Tax=Streptomyces malaysiense TaxID=1428626 RepID=A0A1J4Q5V4_9ACTN|nr:hypothetical protein VT52_006860 [Streptomyces malaysiense]